MSLRLVLVVFATGLTSFLSTYLSSSVNLALKTIGTELAVSPSSLSLLTSVYLLCSSVCIVPFGKVSDTYGPKRTLVFGCGFFILSNLLVPHLAQGFRSLLLLRGIQGVASAFLVVSNTPIIVGVVPLKHRTTALGVLSGLVYFGNSVGSFVGGALTEVFGWRSIFWSAAGGAGVALVLLQLLVPATRPGGGNRGPLDVPGILFYALALVSLQTGASRLTSPLGPWLLGGCALAFALFLRRQTRAENPVFDLRLFLTNRVFALANGAVFLNFLATYGSQYLLPLYLQCNRGMSPLEAGKITLYQPLMQVFFSPLAGWLASRVPPAWVATGGMGLIAAALVLFSRLTEQTPLSLVVTGLVLVGVGISFFSAPNTSIIMEAAPPERRGMAAASNSLMRNLGMQCSIILCGVAFLLALGQVKGIPPERYGDMLGATRRCFAFFAGVCCLGMVLSLARTRRGPEGGRTGEEA